MKRITKNATEKNRFTRMCIGEAIVALLQKKEFSQIKITDIARKSGVSRMTFYHYYDDKLDALNDYLQEMIMGYLHESRKQARGYHFNSYPSILFALNYFERYSLFFTTLNQAGLYSIMIDAINDFMIHHFGSRYHESIYELFYYAGALLNTFIKWQEGGRHESPEEIARIICRSLGMS